VHADKPGRGQQVQHVLQSHHRHVGFIGSNDFDVIVKGFDIQNIVQMQLNVLIIAPEQEYFFGY
jgi:hypothetical protein